MQTVAVLISCVLATCVVNVSGKSCGDPGTPRHGQRVGDDFRYGSTVHFSCNEGYHLTGARRRTCLIDHTWSGSLPVCNRIYCTILPNIANSEHVSYYPSSVSKNRVPHGTKATVQCARGFVYSQPSNVRQCTGSEPTGVWSGGEGQCKETDCEIQEIVNGQFDAIGGSTEYSSYATFKCNLGAIMKPELSAGETMVLSQCGIDGKWDPPVPECEEIDCGTPNFPNGKFTMMTNRTTYSSLAKFTCNSGFEMRPKLPEGVNDLLTECRRDGKWNLIPECKKKCTGLCAWWLLWCDCV